MSDAAFDTSVPHPARVYDYWLRGKDNFAADRKAAEDILRVMPSMAQVARSCRLFLSTVVHHLAADLGIRQFLDIGTGLPTADNTHEVAQRAAPEARIAPLGQWAPGVKETGPATLPTYTALARKPARAVTAAAC